MYNFASKLYHMRNLITFMVLFAFANLIKAQNEGLKGTWFATSQVGYTQTKTGDAKHTNFTILPILGTFIKPTTAVGIAAGISSIKSEAGSATLANTSLLVVQPLIRKYYGVGGGMYFFGQLAAPIITGKEKQSNLKVSQFGLSASGGFDMIIGKHFTVELSYNLAGLTFTTLDPDGSGDDKTKITDFSLAHVANVEQVYTATLGGSNPTLVSPLSFGFKFLF